jgi:hypothetical protein
MSTTSPHSLSLDQAIRQILQKNFDADSKICFITLLKIIDNVLQKPGNEKVRSLRTGNATIRTKIIDKHGHHVLNACGFVHQPNDPRWQREERLVLLESNEDTQLLVKVRHTLARIAVLELGLQAGDIPTYKAPETKVTTTTTTTTDFDVYAGNRFDGQSAAVGTNLGPPENWKSKTEQDLEALKKREAQIQRELANKRGNNNNNNTHHRPAVDGLFAGPKTVTVVPTGSVLRRGHGQFHRSETDIIHAVVEQQHEGGLFATGLPFSATARQAAGLRNKGIYDQGDAGPGKTQKVQGI